MAKRRYRGKKKSASTGKKRPDSALYKWMMRRKITGKKLPAVTSGRKKRTYKGVVFKPGTSTKEKRMVKSAQGQEDRDETRMMRNARSQERANKGRYLYTGRNGKRVYSNDPYDKYNDPNFRY